MRTDEQELLDIALNTLPFKPDIQLEASPNPNPSGPDAYGTLRFNGQTRTVAIEVKTRPIDRVSTLMGVWSQLQKWQHASDGILVTTYLSPKLAEHCRDQNLQFIDSVGNCFIKQPDLFLWHYGNPKPADFGLKEASTSTITKIVFIFLAYPDTVTSAYRDIARYAGVSVGSVSNALTQLEKENWLKPESGGQPRRLINQQQLLTKWLDDYTRTLYRKRKAQRFSQTDQTSLNVHINEIQLKKYDAQWGAESAAALITHYLKPAVHTLYLRGDRRSLIKDLRLRPDPDGDIEMIEPFWTPPSFYSQSTTDVVFDDCVPTLLVIADLLASGDVRNSETAKLMQEKFFNVDR